MKKAIIIIGAVMVGVIIPFLGMTITPTRDLILGMAPDEAILILADKIDRESGKNDEQEQNITELQNINTQQSEAMTRQEGRMTCETKKAECRDEISPLQAKIEDFNKNIKHEKADIVIFEKDSKECGTGTCVSKQMLEKALVRLKDLEISLANINNQVNNLTNGECKDYQVPCE